MNTKKIGFICELKIACFYAQNNYTVLFPYGDNAPYDLVCELDGAFIKVQCKTAKMKNNKITFSLSSTMYSSKHGKVVKIPCDKSKIDVFGVFCPDIEVVYIIPVGEINGFTSFTRSVDEMDKYRCS